MTKGEEKRVEWIWPKTHLCPFGNGSGKPAISGAWPSTNIPLPSSPFLFNLFVFKKSCIHLLCLKPTTSPVPEFFLDRIPNWHWLPHFLPEHSQMVYHPRQKVSLLLDQIEDISFSGELRTHQTKHELGVLHWNLMFRNIWSCFRLGPQGEGA